MRQWFEHVAEGCGRKRGGSAVAHPPVKPMCRQQHERPEEGSPFLSCPPENQLILCDHIPRVRAQTSGRAASRVVHNGRQSKIFARKRSRIQVCLSTEICVPRRGHGRWREAKNSQWRPVGYADSTSPKSFSNAIRETAAESGGADFVERQIDSFARASTRLALGKLEAPRLLGPARSGIVKWKI
jgi:hypothetical protein